MVVEDRIFLHFAEKKLSKKRTHCTEFQLKELEKAFHINPVATVSNIKPLCIRLGITTQAARLWFHKWQLQETMKMDETEPSKYGILTDCILSIHPSFFVLPTIL